MDLSIMRDNYMANTTALHNDWNGIMLYTMTNTYMTNMTASHNDGSGMALFSITGMPNTFITNTTAIQKLMATLEYSNYLR